MSQFRVLVSDKLGRAGLALLEQADDTTHSVETGLSRDELVSAIPDYDALIVRSATLVDAAVLEAGKRLKVVGRAGIGVDNIDVKSATALGILIMNTPEANAIATAEHTLMLLLSASRYVVQAHAAVETGEWQRSRFVGIQLHRKTLGLIGLGRIARLVAMRTQAFGMEVIAYDPYVSEQVGQELGVTLVDLDDLMAQSDYISLHAIASPETTDIVNAARIAQMKDGVILVNAARAELVDEVALAEALRDGKVRAAAIDVFRQEPPPADHPLLGLDNVLHTPHLGASTQEAQTDVATQIVEQVLDALRDKEFRNAINLPYPSGPEFEAQLPYMVLAEKMGILQFHMAAPNPIRRIELELKGEHVDGLARPVAAALLKGLLEQFLADKVNYINAPVLAEEHGITISQSKGVAAADYSNLISCRVHWDGGSRVMAGVLFGGKQPRIVQVSNYHLDAAPIGTLLIVRNKDVPGVIGQVGTILGAYGVNIGEWRMGRNEPGEEALSFINLDSQPSAATLDALENVPAITKLKLLNF